VTTTIFDATVVPPFERPPPGSGK